MRKEELDHFDDEKLPKWEEVIRDLIFLGLSLFVVGILLFLFTRGIAS